MILRADWSNIPVTALCFLKSSHACEILLAGEGTYLKAYHRESGLLVQKIHIFEAAAIHGINSYEIDAGNYLVLVWGGHWLCQLQIKCVEGRLHVTSKAIDRFPSWIFHAASSEVATNKTVAVITADNSLHFLSPNLASKVTIRDLPVDLYSASLKWLDASRVLVASGTVFGEVIAWSGSVSGESEFYNTFVGHEGSIFGVTISDLIQGSRYLASCSDDRTIRLWDVTNLVPQLRSSKQDKETGFLKEQLRAHSQATAIGWGHTSRIWGLLFFPDQLRLISHGEDATCRVWIIPGSEREFQPAKLECSFNFHEHSGKNVWSLALYRESTDVEIASGGADGKIALIQLKDSPNANKTLQYSLDEVTNIDCEMAGITRLNDKHVQTQSIRKSAKKGDYLKKVIALGENGLLLVSNDGLLSKISLNPVFQVERCIRLDTIRGYALFSDYETGYVCFAGSDRGVYLCSSHSPEVVHLDTMAARVDGVFLRTGVAFSTSEQPKVICPVISIAAPQSAIAMKLDIRSPSVSVLQKIVIGLPHGFRTTSASWIQDLDLLVLGSRRGAVAVYKFGSSPSSEALQPLDCVRHVHGDDGVSCVRTLSGKSSKSMAYIATTGRDGTYAVFSLSLNTPGKVEIALIHSSAPPLGPMLEGVNFVPNTILHGFRLTQFVVYDECDERDLAVIDCGGANRSWTLVKNRLAWFQHGDLHIREFENKRVLQRGGHGREIKALATNAAKGLMATGAEDTTVKIWSCPTANQDAKVLRMLKRHTAGLQALAWSKDGTYLFSSAGLEEFYVWKVTILPDAAHAFVGTICEASLPKFSGNEDLRITAFSILERGAGKFAIGMVCSDSTMRVYIYDSDNQSFQLLCVGIYKTCCLTQAEFVPLNKKLFLVGAATDGHIMIWRLPQIFGRSVGADTPSGLENDIKRSNDQSSESVKTESVTEVSIIWQKAVHQNSIKALQFIPLQQGVLLVTGGDDNALGLTALRFSEIDDQIESSSILVPKAHSASLTALEILPSENSLAPSGAKERTSAKERTFRIATSGNDQRLKIWEICVSDPKNGESENAEEHNIWPPRLSLRRLADKHTLVADISSMQAWTSHSEEHELGNKDCIMVAGVGIESWTLDPKY